MEGKGGELRENMYTKYAPRDNGGDAVVVKPKEIAARKTCAFLRIVRESSARVEREQPRTFDDIFKPSYSSSVYRPQKRAAGKASASETDSPPAALPGAGRGARLETREAEGELEGCMSTDLGPASACFE